MAPSFRNVLLNQLNGPLTEQGPRKLGKMGMAAQAAHSRASEKGSAVRGSLGSGLAFETFIIFLLTLALAPAWLLPDLVGTGSPDPGL